MPTIKLERVNGTPVFIVDAFEERFRRIHANMPDPANKRFVFPAYPPFGLSVVSDIEKVAPDLHWLGDALAQRDWLREVPDKIKNRVLPATLTYPEDKKPFEHQLEALTHIYYNPRYGLLYDPGLGKTKILLDLLRLLPGKRAIVLTPKITVENWLKEAEIHAPGLRTVAVNGTVKRKRKIISRYKDYDLLVMSYGTARLLAFPQITSITAKQILAVKRQDPLRSDHSMKAMAAVIKGVGTQDRQTAYVLAWALGMPVAHIERAAAAEAKAAPTWLCDIDYEIIIADESQRIQEGSSLQTQAAIQLAKKAQRRYISSGTAVLGDPRDIYTQMKFLSAAIIPEDWFKFSDQYLVRAKWNPKIITGFKNMDVLNKRIQRMAISRKKDECLDLPPRSIIDVPFSLSSKQIKMYNELVEENSADLANYFTDPTSQVMETPSAITRLNKLSQIASGFVYNTPPKKDLCNGCVHVADCVTKRIQPYTKLCQVEKEEPARTTEFFDPNPRLELLEETLEKIFLDPKAKVILWYWYGAEFEVIEKLFAKKKWEFTGPHATSSKKTQDNIEDFQKDPSVRAWIGQEKSGIGITLTAATYMIYYSIDFSLEPYLQSIDRNYRVGQKSKVTVYRLVAEGSLDSYKLSAVDQKQDLSTMLTKNLACATCPQRLPCLEKRIKLFDPGCLYQRSVTRVVAKARIIDNEADPGESGSPEDHPEGVRGDL